MATSPGPDAAPAGRVRWRRVLLVLTAGVLGLIAITHAVGGTTMTWIGIGAGVLVLAGGWLIINPWLHRHLHPGGKPEKRARSRTRGSLNYPGQRGRGLRQPFRSPGSPGRRHRPAMAPFRRPGGAGSRRARSSGILGRRRRPAGSAVSPRRRGGAGQPRRRIGALSRHSRRPVGRPGSGTGSRLAARRFTPFRSRSRSFSGRRRSSGPFSGTRRKTSAGRRAGAGTAAGRRFRSWRPSAWHRPRRRPGGRTSPGGGPSARTSPRRRRLIIPFRRRGRAGTGRGAGTG